MTYQEVLVQARERLAPRCKVCGECNGLGCRGVIPGPGAKGSARTFLRNFSYLADKVRIHMDVLAPEAARDCSLRLFGKDFAAPVFCAPIGMVAFNYANSMNEKNYAQAVVEGTKAAGTAAFTGGGLVDECFFEPLEVIRQNDGWGIPTLKPWSMELLQERVAIMEKSSPFAFAMDIDSAGLAHASASNHKMSAKSADHIQRIVSFTQIPFIVKGIMTPASAKKAIEAGAAAIVVSNHGGRVLDYGPASTEVLPSIRAAVGKSAIIFVDGGIRTGADLFKIRALGADAALIGRPYAIAAYGGGSEGVKLYTQKLIQELRDTMTMTSCASLAGITRDKIDVLDR